MARRALDFPRRYADLLAEHVAARDEITLHAAYELGRTALIEGRGVLDVVHAHGTALEQLAKGLELDAELLAAASVFLAECLSAYEVSHRGVREANLALRRLNDALENEVRRIAHALHDEAGQLLASVHIALAEVRRAMPEDQRPELDQVFWLLTRIEDELRGLAHELHPTVLDDLGLGPALELLAEQVGRRHRLHIEVDHSLGGRLPAQVEVALYRTVQEALNNVVRHSRARRAWVAVYREPERVTCTVSDDGVGVPSDPGRVGRGLGLVAMRERLSAVGGGLRLDSAPEHGTTLHAAVQLVEEAR